MGNLLTFLEETETKTDIIFPHLGIALRKVGSYVTVFGIKIMFYGIVIGLAMIIGYLMAEHMAKRTGQNPEPYLDFTIIAVCVFMLVRGINKLKKKEEEKPAAPAPAPEPSAEEKLLAEIRDLLKNK